MNIKWRGKKDFYLNINIGVMSQRRIPSVFFSQIYIFKTFYRDFPPQNVHLLNVSLQKHFMQKYFKYFYIC